MPQRDSYIGTVVGHANRHRMVALFVCVPAALLALHVSSRDEVTGREAISMIVSVVAAYSSGAAAVRAWPSRGKQALAGAPLGAGPLWLFRGLSVACGALALLAALISWLVVRSA